MSSISASLSPLPAHITARVGVPDAEQDVLFLITQYLRDLGLSTTVVALLRESGIDPFWLCGPSREVALLREWVLQGEWARVRTLLTPLRDVLSDESYIVAVALAEKQARIEEFFLKPTPTTRRREILDEIQSHSVHDAVRLTRQEMQRCLRVLKGEPLSDWSLDEARLSCFEALVPLFRDEITDDDDESKYLRMPRRQLVALLGDALLLHQQSRQRSDGPVDGLGDLVSLTPRSSAMLASTGEKDEDGESQSSLQLAETAPRRRMQATDALAQSMDGLRAPDLKAPMPKVAEGRKHNPLVMSMDFSQRRHDRRRRTSLKTREVDQIEEEEEGDVVIPAEECVDESTQTDPIVKEAPGRVEAAASTDDKELLWRSSVRDSQELHESSSGVTSNQTTEPTDDEHRLNASKAPLASTSLPASPASTSLPHQTEPELRKSTTYFSKSQDSESSSETRREHETPRTFKERKMKEPEDQEDKEQFEDDDTHGEMAEGKPVPLVSYSQLTIDSIVRAHVVAQVREAQAIRALDISPDGSEMVIGTNARALRVFDLSEPLATAAASSSHSTFLPLLPVSMEKHKHHSSSIYVAAYNHIDPDQASPLIATGAAESSIKVLSRWTQQELWIRNHSGKCRALQFTSPHVLCSAASGDLLIRAWNLDTEDGCQPTCVQRFDGHVGEIQALAGSQSGRIDSRCLVSSSMDKTVRLWDQRGAQCARVLARTASPAFTLAFQPHAEATNILATGHQDGSVALWDIRASSKKLSSISHHHDECRAVSWSPDGRWLLSASFDGTLCLMDVASSSQELTAVASFHQHDDKVLQAQWHPTQPAILTTGADKLIKLWGFA